MVSVASVRQSSLREQNLAAVMRSVCRAPEPLSRAGVAADLSMTRATATRLADELVGAGLLDEGAPVVSGPGRPATPLLPGTRIAGLGLLVDADLLAARVVDLGGRLLVDLRAEVPPGDSAAVLAAVAELAEAAVAAAGPRRIAGSALAVPGVVDDAGLLVRAPNLGWSGLDVAAQFRAVGGPALQLVGNEADLAAAVEASSAPGRPGDWLDFAHVSAGVGIGGAVVVRGRVATGDRGGAGEFGHVCVDPHGPPCACGSTGCLERYVGLHVVAAMCDLPPDRVAAELGRRAEEGDPRCLRAREMIVWALSVALASVVNVVGVSRIVLGGYLAELEPAIHDDLRTRLDARVLGSRWSPVQVRPSAADRPAAATGAAFHVLGRVLDAPADWI